MSQASAGKDASSHGSDRDGPPPRRADARRSRERIVSAAQALLEGDPRVPMGEIAAAAGISRSTLHRHFPNRERLVRWVAEERARAASDSSEPREEATLSLAPGATGVEDAPPSASGSTALKPPGQLGRAEPLALEAVHVLDEVPPHLVADQLVAEARRTAGVPVALYVIDVDGSGLLRLAGDEANLPARLEVALGLGQEIAPDSLPDLYAHLEAELPGCVAAPLWLRGRATGLLVAVGTPRNPLTEIARQGAAALELANGYTDVFEGVRRRRATTPAAEMQLNLLPAARIARVAGGEFAGGLLPSKEVGGDWFDFAENRDGAWLAIADAAGEGPLAAGRAAVSLGALRSARRRGLGLEGSALAVHQLVHDLGDDFSVAAVLAHWQAVASVFSWVCAGHGPPLLVTREGTVAELTSQPEPALGVSRRDRRFRREQRRLRRGERVILHSDGVFERRGKGDRPFGLAGIEGAVAQARGVSAAATARSIQNAVGAASPRPLEDDATVVVLAVV